MRQVEINLHDILDFVNRAEDDEDLDGVALEAMEKIAAWTGGVTDEEIASYTEKLGRYDDADGARERLTNWRDRVMW